MHSQAARFGVGGRVEVARKFEFYECDMSINLERWGGKRTAAGQAG
jgi:hypothetical protein